MKQANGNLILNGLIQSKLDFSNTKDGNYINSFVRNVSTFLKVMLRTVDKK